MVDTGVGLDNDNAHYSVCVCKMIVLSIHMNDYTKYTNSLDQDCISLSVCECLHIHTMIEARSEMCLMGGVMHVSSGDQLFDVAMCWWWVDVICV